MIASRSLSRSKALALAVYERALTRRGLSPATIRTRHYLLLRFLDFVRGRHLGWLTRADLARYLAQRAASVGASSVAQETSVLRHFLATLVDEGLIRRSAAGDLPVPRARKRVPVLLSPNDIEALLAAASQGARDRAWAGLRDRAALELLYGVGLRAAELRAAQVVDLDLEEGTLLVRRAKRGREKVLPVPPAARPHLRAYLADARPRLTHFGGGRDQGRLILGSTGRPLSEHGVHRLVERVARRAGVRAHPHAIRRAVASHLVRAGASVLAVQSLLGHQRLDTTAIYVACDRDDLRAAVDLLDRPRRR